MQPLKLALCASGDPRSLRTWSGTPAQICRALEQTNHLGATLDSEACLSKPVRLVLKLAGKVYYAGSSHVRLGRIERALRARCVRARLNSKIEDATHLLHLGTLALPPAPPRDSRQRHYLFTDSTWHLWHAHTTGAHTISKRLARDVELLERASYAAVDHVFTTGEYVKQDLIAAYHLPAEKITVVGTGRGILQPFHGEKDYRAGGILFVAKERFLDKGGARLLAGFALAYQRDPSLRLTVAGSDEYHRLIKEQPGVTIRGHVTINELQELFNKASLFAMPAINEPWGLVFLEALGCRTPVLGLGRLALPELTGHGQYGFCLNTGEPAEIADALCAAFADPAELARMGTAGQAFCLENFTWERTARLMVEKIESLVSA